MGPANGDRTGTNLILGPANGGGIPGLMVTRLVPISFGVLLTVSGPVFDTHRHGW